MLINMFNLSKTASIFLTFQVCVIQFLDYEETTKTKKYAGFPKKILFEKKPTYICYETNLMYIMDDDKLNEVYQSQTRQESHQN